MENETRRKGIDRRMEQIPVDEDNRKSNDRRAIVSESDRILEFLQKIPIFKGFTNEQSHEILNICKQKKFQKDQYICEKGDKSEELFILLKGQLRIVRSNITLTHVLSLGLVGEIGIFTGSRRSASVLANEDSTVIVIHKNEIFELLKNDCVLSNRLLLNVIRDLANKLYEDNEVIEGLRNKKFTRML